jgi:hypothetical protein
VALRSDKDPHDIVRERETSAKGDA